MKRLNSVDFKMLVDLLLVNVKNPRVRHEHRSFYYVPPMVRAS